MTKFLLLFTLSLLPFLAQEAGAQDAPADGSHQTAPQTVVVQGKRAAVIRRIDRKIYRADSDIQSSSGTAGDLLNTIPSVDVDADGKVSLRGDSSVTILVDGKPSAQLSGATGGDGLSQIPAADIDRIEVITNPSAQFKADGSGGMINIILKKTRKPGLSGSSQINLGNDGRYNLGGSIALNRGKLDLSGGVGFRQDERFRQVIDNRSNIDPLTSQTVNNAHDLAEQISRQMQSLKASAGYALTDRDKLGVNVSWAERHGDRYFLQQDQTLDDSNLPTKSSNRYSDGKEWRLDLQQGLSYTRQMGRDGETLDVNLQRTITRERENYFYRNTFALPSGPDTHDTLHLGLDLVNTDFTVDYVLPLFGERTLKLGFDFTRDDNNYDNSGTVLNPVTGQYEVDPQITNHFRYYQAIQAAYATYQTQAGAFDVLYSLRVEDARIRTHQITGAMNGEDSYLRVYPSLHLSYNLSDSQKLFTSFSARVERADPEDRNPFADYQDTHNLRTGNPDLKPAETESLEAGYSYDSKDASYSTTAYWRNTHNAVSDVSQVISDDVVLLTKTNIPRSRAGGVEFAASGKILPRLGYNISGNVFYNEIDPTPFDATGVRSNIAANTKASLDFKPTPADTWQFSGNYNGKRLTAQGYILPVFTVNMGYKRQVRANLAMVLTVSDVFDGQKFRRVIDTPALHERYSRQQAGRIIYVGLTYTGGALKKPKNTFDYE